MLCTDQALLVRRYLHQPDGHRLPLPAPICVKVALARPVTAVMST